MYVTLLRLFGVDDFFEPFGAAAVLGQEPEQLRGLLPVGHGLHLSLIHI